MALPGVKVGPLDPDATSEFGQVSGKSSARQLIRLHTQAHPPQLVQALARPLDEPRTKALDLKEVGEFVAGLKHDNGDPVLATGARVVGASVHGHPDSEQLLAFTFELPSGRTAKWFAPYDENDLPESYAAGTELSKVKEMKDRGVVAWDSGGTDAEILRRENAGIRRENEALRAQVEARGSGKLPPETSGDTRPDTVVVGENERLARENEELKARVMQFESLDQAAGGGVPTAGVSELSAGIAADDPPFEGYDDLKADELSKRLKASDTSDAEREAVLGYERAHQNRKSVVAAAEESLGSRSG